MTRNARMTHPMQDELERDEWMDPAGEMDAHTTPRPQRDGCQDVPAMHYTNRPDIP